MKKVKVCGLSRQADIAAVNKEKPDYCGFIVNFPRSRRNVSADQLKSLTAMLDPEVIPVGVFVDQPPEEIAELLNDGTIGVAQLHGREDTAYISRLRGMTRKPIWQAFQIHSEDDVKRAADSSADLVLLDAGQGTGSVFDWNLLLDFPIPYALAGGLHLGNLDSALQTEAVLLDVSSGVETDGFKDPEKISLFIRKVREEL